MIPRIRTALLAVIVLLSCLQTAFAKTNSSDITWVTYQEPDGSTVYLQDDRQPALYTGNFGDCLGSSDINVTRFDAAYYVDNMTVLFHLAGNTALVNQSLMMYIGVFAYGESRFDLTFNPCLANINSLCPVDSSVPIVASGIIPVAESDVATIPSIAFSIPDFEGEAILRIFANATEQEIGCYSAVVTNGNSFSQPASVGSVLGIFTFVALVASFATAAYGEAVPTMRLHYAHSLSVGVVFAVFQHIFYTGALSMNWPSVLVAWWSNFAWAGGMIYSETMQNSINKLIGNNVGNTTEVGAAASGSNEPSLGGGYDISQIYKRASAYGTKHPLVRDVGSEIYGRPSGNVLRRDIFQRTMERTLQQRADDTGLVNSSSGYKWYGHPVGAGLPLPGNYSGFAGTLAEENIRTSNAFMTGFLWFLILLVLLVAAVMALKWILEGLARIKTIKQERFQFFREHWLAYSAAIALRTCYLGFFMMMFLTIFQFTYQSSGGVKAIAAIVFVIFIVGIPGAALYALEYKKKVDRGEDNMANAQFERKKLLGKVPWFSVKKAQPPADNGAETEVPPPRSESTSKSAPFWKRTSLRGSITADNQSHLHTIHDNEDYIMKFGWLAARFRRTRWWFFAVWLFYEFVRAVFYAGASGYPLAQVFGLLIVEFVAFCYIVWARPFEGRRLNVLVVYCLGFSKVTTVALSAAFDVQFNLPRIDTTVIGIVIIVIQGILTIITLIAIIVGAISSYMSVSRNNETFRPKKWGGLREKYFNHLDRVANDLPPEPKPQGPSEPEEPSQPYFEMKSVKRMAKIEDEDAEFSSEMRNPQDPAASQLNLEEQAASPGRVESIRSGLRSGAGTPVGRSRATSLQSMSQSNLPYGARPLRPSWSTKDFAQFDRDGGNNDRSFTPVDMSRNVPDDDPIVSPAPAKTSHFRSPSRSATLPTKLQTAPSSDALRVGGDISTRDTIGSVPAPTVRPRAGTYGSVRSLEASSSRTSGDLLGDAQFAQASSQRASRNPLLTPAQEQEEFDMRTPTKQR